MYYREPCEENIWSMQSGRDEARRLRVIVVDAKRSLRTGQISRRLPQYYWGTTLNGPRLCFGAAICNLLADIFVETTRL